MLAVARRCRSGVVRVLAVPTLLAGVVTLMTVVAPPAHARLPAIQVDKDTASTYTFTPKQDTYVGSTDTVNHGSETVMKVNSATPRYAYLNFQTSNLVKHVTSATLRLYVTTSNPVALRVHAVDNTGWNENNTTWATRPGLGGVVDSALGVKAGTWVYFDVTSAVKSYGNGSYSLGVSTFSTTDIAFNSRNASSNKPVLSIVTNGGSTDATYPTFTSIEPDNGSTVSGTVPLSAQVSDNVSVAWTQFAIDGTVRARQTAGPWRYDWDTTQESNGAHDVVVEASDSSGNVSSTYTTVLVDNVEAVPPGPDVSGPAVSIGSPANGSTVKASVNIVANATDPSGVFSVRFYVGSQLWCIDTDDRYECLWETLTGGFPNAPYNLQAQGMDLLGNMSDPVGVDVLLQN